MNIDRDATYKFVYSREHHDKMVNIRTKINKAFIPKKIIVGGLAKEFTDIIEISQESEYTDAKLVTVGKYYDQTII